jgi:chemotaxis protein methyltransferase CheR
MKKEHLTGYWIMLPTEQEITAAPPPTDAIVQEFSQFLAAQMGLNFPRERWTDLLRGITPLARELNFSCPELCMRSLMASPLTRNNVERLANHLSVGETYFFREPAVFSALEQFVLPQLIESRRVAGNKRLRIWSAGCCTGEEVYSLAILVSRLISDVNSWNITILGTDINPGFLAKAKQGIFRDWSFRNVPAWLKPGYFDIHEPGSYTIRSSIRQLVAFDYLNLAEETYPAPANNTSAMDIVLCRNVLMYFDAGQVGEVSRKLYRSLIDGGWLIVGAAETSQQLFPQFKTISFPDTSFYHKEGEYGLSPPMEFRKPTFPEYFYIPAAGGITPETEKSLYEPGTHHHAAVTVTTSRENDLADIVLSARACANTGRHAEALAFCKSAIALDKCNPGLRYLVAVILQEQGDFEDAINALKQAIYLDPGFVLGYFTLGSLCHRQKNYAHARKYFAHSLELLQNYAPDDVLPDSEGMSAGKLIGIIKATEGCS